jgi:hypothetical protein
MQNNLYQNGKVPSKEVLLMSISKNDTISDNNYQISNGTWESISGNIFVFNGNCFRFIYARTQKEIRGSFIFTNSSIAFKTEDNKNYDQKIILVNKKTVRVEYNHSNCFCYGTFVKKEEFKDEN